MAWSGSGTYTRTNGTNTGATLWVADAAAGTKITTARHDTHDEDIATAITACLTKNMETKPTADFVPNTTATYDLGTASLKWEDLHLNGNALIGGTLGITGALSGPIMTLETPLVTTSGTTKDFTIPSWANQVTVTLSGVSSDGTSEYLIQVGDAGGIETASYLSFCRDGAGTAGVTTGFNITRTTSAAGTYSGSVILTRHSSTAFTWVSQGNIVDAGGIHSSSGVKSLSAALTTVRLTSGSADTLDAGAVNVVYS